MIPINFGPGSSQGHDGSRSQISGEGAKKDFWLRIVGHLNASLGMVGDETMGDIGCPIADIKSCFRVLHDTVAEKAGHPRRLNKPYGGRIAARGGG